MKTEEFKKAIKLLIREEVKKAVAEEVNKAMGKVLVEMVKEIKINNKAPIVESEEPLQEIIHTKNPKLNSVLAETARYSRPLPRGESANLAELMNGGFDKIGTTETTGVIEKPSTNMGFIKQMVGNSPMIPQQQSVLDSNEVPDVLKGVFKKDFRATMKKIDEAKKSGMNSAQVGFME
jgi:hypothetical protein